MWHTEDDIINDLAFLNDFGVPGDKEPYKVLYSSGRGSRVQEKPTVPASFIDPRTGETIIDDNSLDLNGDIRGKGRGSTLGSLTKANCQLIKQLRMARPLGSSDQVIESYCQRNKPTMMNDFSSRTMATSCSEQNVPKSIPESNAVCDSKQPNKTIQRVKGTRNSNLQNNALIAGLLSKTKENSDESSVVAEGRKNGDAEFETSNINDQKYNSKLYVPPHRRKELQNDKSESTSGEVTKDSVPNLLSAMSDLNWSSIYDQNIHVKKSGEEEVPKTLGRIIANDDSSSDTTESIDCVQERSKQSSVDSPEQNVDEQTKCDEVYRKLGERLNRMNKINQRSCREGIYDFNHAQQCSSSTTNECNEQFEVMFFPESEESFTLDQEDFPPLCSN